MPELSARTQRFLFAQLAGDGQAALRVIDEALGEGAKASSLHLEVIQAAQYEIGRLWEKNRVSIAQEHVATAISQLAIAHLYPQLARARPIGKRVLVACVEGEMHDLGARIGADFLEVAGFEVRYAGANVPGASLVTLAREAAPDVLVLSVTLAFHIPALRDAVTRLREAFGTSLPIAAGGRVFAWAPGLAEQLGIRTTGTDVEALVDVVRELAHAIEPTDRGEDA